MTSGNRKIRETSSRFLEKFREFDGSFARRMGRNGAGCQDENEGDVTVDFADTKQILRKRTKKNVPTYIKCTCIHKLGSLNGLIPW